MRFHAYAIVAAAVLLATSCAKQGYPNGGPRDVTPPRVVSVSPASGTTRFSERMFTIGFDEFVVLQDAENNIIVSPPLQPKPQYSIRGRSLEVKLPDTLRDNTTYLFQMHGAIVDFTEGNPIGNLEYAFSTGRTIDSLTIVGCVLSAYTGEPMTQTVTVMLYRVSDDNAWNDSTVCTTQPNYVARCNEDGTFRVNHLAEGHYRIFAIEDINRNLRYNSQEPIAFIDTVFKPVYIAPPTVQPVANHDTVANDTVSTDIDSTMAAVLPVGIEAIRMLISIDSSQKVQRVTSANFLQKGKILITTAAPMLQPSIACTDSLIWHLGTNRDSLFIWTHHADCDSTVILLTDTSGVNDTLKLQWRPKVARRRNADATEKTPTLSSRLLCSSKMGVFDTLRVAVENPVATVSDSAIQIFNIDDSTTATARIRFDSTAMSGYIDTLLAAGKKYKLTLVKGAITDLWGWKNNESETTVEILSVEQYGNIFITCHAALPHHTVVVLLTDKGEQVRSIPWPEGSTRIAFEHLSPGKYRIMAFSDTNGDRHWTPGNYWQHRQPEQVFRLDKTFDVRENWDIEETWQILQQ